MAHLFQLKYKVRGEAMKNPGEGIVRIAEEEKAEMIIMGTRGLGKVRWLTQFSFKTTCMKKQRRPLLINKVKSIESHWNRQEELVGLIFEHLRSSPKAHL